MDAVKDEPDDHRGKQPETAQGSAELMKQHFPDGAYRDVPGLCKVATLADVEAQGWSLNPGRYVGVTAREEDEGFDFAERLTELHEELEVLNAEASGVFLVPRQALSPDYRELTSAEAAGSPPIRAA